MDMRMRVQVSQKARDIGFYRTAVTGIEELTSGPLPEALSRFLSVS